MLKESGFIEVEVTGKSGDGGIDGRGGNYSESSPLFGALLPLNYHLSNVPFWQIAALLSHHCPECFRYDRSQGPLHDGQQ